MDYFTKQGEFPKIMGIVNVTPDSFSDGGSYSRTDEAVSHGLALLEDGADILDIGGESTRPGAKAVSSEEEAARVLPVISALRKARPDVTISVDTTKYRVAKAALDNGASIINDVSGLDFDPLLAALSAEYDAPVIIMHMQGSPRTMQNNPVYDNVVEDIYRILKDKISLALEYGAKKIIADVGIGFGKTVGHNLQLLRNSGRFRELGVPLLLGISRKTFIGKILAIEQPSERDFATAVLHSLLPGFGGDIIRVHNVAMMNTVRMLYNTLQCR